MQQKTAYSCTETPSTNEPALVKDNLAVDSQHSSFLSKKAVSGSMVGTIYLIFCSVSPCIICI